MGSVVFTASSVALLRSPTRPITRFRLPPEPGPTAIPGPDLWLRAAAADRVLREAVEVSSPSLAARWSALLQGAAADPAALRRAVLGVAAYAARSAGRATPFGLLAGVTSVRFGDQVAVRVGGNDRTVTRPDQTLLVAAAARLQRDPAVLAGLRVVAHPQLRERGGRVGLTRPQGVDVPLAGAPLVQEVSVRATAAVRTLLRGAAGWITVADLVDHVAEQLGDRVPGGPAGTGDSAIGSAAVIRGQISAAVAGLLSAGLLVSDLLPAPGAADPLGEMLQRLPRPDALTNEAGIQADGDTDVDIGGAAAAGRWGAAAAAARCYDARRLGDGRAQFQDLTQTLLELGDVPNVAQVDVVLDAPVQLPAAVATEAAAAASVLWKLFGHGPTRFTSPSGGAGAGPADATGLAGPGLTAGPLAGWHRRFLEQFGTDRLVPLLDVVDERAGLGVPDSYLAGGPAADHNPAHGTGDAVWPADPAVLTTALSLAVSRGAVQVDLDEVLYQLGDQLHQPPGQLPEGSPTGEAPTSVELYARLAAADLDGLRDGRFWLLDVGFGGGLGGASFARFEHLLDAGAVTAVREHVGGRSPRAPGAVHVEVAALPLHQRPRNLAHCPRWLPHRLCLDEPPAAAGDIAPGDVAVGATADTLYLVCVSTGRQMVPVMHTRLARWLLPPLARLCLDIGDLDDGTVAMWSWGPLEAAPFLPRVITGRSVLAPATWRLPAPLRSAARAAHPAARRATDFRAGAGHPGGLDSGWAQQLTAWRAAAGVPALVTVGAGDIRLPLDLQDPIHQALLQREIVDRDAVFLSEWFGPDMPLPELSAQPACGVDAMPETAGAGQAMAAEPVVDGWFAGVDGPRIAEIVIPLAAGPDRLRLPAGTVGRPRGGRAAGPPVTLVPAARGRPAVVRRPGAGSIQPGGPWLCAHLDVASRDQNAVLAALDATVRPAAVAAGVDRWFFIRYASSGRPHLRLRFHGDPAALHRQLLPVLHDWVSGLRDAGVAGELVLAGYDPEIERYGGPAAVLLAEQVFAADSEAVLATFAAAQPGLAWPAVAAVGAAELAAACDPDSGSSSWLLATRGRATTYRAEVRQLVASGQLPARLGPRAAAAWSRRRARTQALAERLHRDAAASAVRSRVAESLVHMHCNRLLGLSPDLEAMAVRLARDGLLSGPWAHLTGPRPAAPAEHSDAHRVGRNTSGRTVLVDD